MTPATVPHMPASRLNVIFKGGSWLRGFFVISFGATTAIALTMATFRVLQSQPSEAFGLLKAWGPSFLIGILAIYLLSSLLERAIDKGLQILREYFASTAESQKESVLAQKESAIAMQALASGVQQIANKDDRQLQELQTLTAFTGQQSEKMYTRLLDMHDKIDSKFAGIEGKFDEILTEVKRRP